MSILTNFGDAGKIPSQQRTLLGDLVGRHGAAAAPADHPAVAFLKTLDLNGWHNLVRFDPTERRKEPIGLTIPLGRWDLAERFVSEFAGRENLYFSVNEPRPNAPDKKLTKADIGAIRALPADIDLPGVNGEAEIARLQAQVATDAADLPAPTFVVDSGGGVQLHWRLAQKLPADEATVTWAEDQARAIARELGGDDVGNVDRIMRLPGTANIPNTGKRAKGRTERQATLTGSAGASHSPEALRAALPPIPKATGDRLDNNERVAAVQAELVAGWADVAGAAEFDDLPAALRDRFSAARTNSPKLQALWEGEPPRSGDVTGSGYRAALAQALARAGGFDVFDFAALAWAWDFAVQPHHVRDEKLTPRALARDWARIGETTPSSSAIAEQWFERPTNVVPLFPETAEQGGGPVGTYELLSIGDLLTRPDPVFMLERHIPEASLGFLYGDPGTGKSFIALDWALHMAFGRMDWHGDAIRLPAGASVVYIAAEGASGFKTRVRAWMKARGIAPDQPGRLGLIFQNVNFMQRDDVERLAATLRSRVAGRTCLLVVDTVSRAMPGADENLQKEMTLFVEACQSLQREFGATVLGVHHANKSGDMRGSGVLKGAGDFVFKLERKIGAKIGTLRCEKQKDAPDGWTDTYSLDEVHVDGGQISLVPNRCEKPSAAGLTPNVSDSILDAIDAAWVKGEPWSANYRTPKRYAVNLMCKDFGLSLDAAKSLLAHWLGTGVLEDVEFQKKNHSKGLRVHRERQNDADETDNLSETEVESVFD